MSDMRQTIIPKSDQMNSDDLIASPITIKITRVEIREGTEQPVSIYYAGGNGKPYKPCKSMCRVMVQLWGADANKYVGRSMTLYRDPSVKWGGMEIGGIRISHMSDTDKMHSIPLTVTRGSKKNHTVKQLAIEKNEDITHVLEDARSSALHGVASYQAYFEGLTPENKRLLLPGHEELKRIAKEADASFANPEANYESAKEGE